MIPTRAPVARAASSLLTKALLVTVFLGTATAQATRTATRTAPRNAGASPLIEVSRKAATKDITCDPLQRDGMEPGNLKRADGGRTPGCA